MMKKTTLSILFGLCGTTGLHAASNDVPWHPGVGRLPTCESVSVERTCRIAVPNGDFEGPEDDGVYTHGYEPLKFWRWPHSVAEHISPWVYLDHAGTGYALAEAADDIVLKSVGDAITQSIALPPVRGTVGYTVHAHVGAWSGTNDVRMELTLFDADRAVASANRTVQLRSPSSTASRELVGWVEAPVGIMATDLRISLAVQAGWGATSIDDVFIVRAQPDAYVPELQPDPAASRIRRWSP